MEGEVEEAVVERLNEVVVALEAVVARLGEPQIVAGTETRAERIVATVASEREEELERKLAALQASAGGRKTVSVGRMAAKEAGETNLAGVLDGALRSLSMEQRIAVKAELMRAGVM